jgi:hypothetical protein
LAFDIFTKIWDHHHLIGAIPNRVDGVVAVIVCAIVSCLVKARPHYLARLRPAETLHAVERETAADPGRKDRPMSESSAS